MKFVIFNLSIAWSWSQYERWFSSLFIYFSRLLIPKTATPSSIISGWNRLFNLPTALLGRSPIYFTFLGHSFLKTALHNCILYEQNQWLKLALPTTFVWSPISSNFLVFCLKICGWNWQCQPANNFCLFPNRHQWCYGPYGRPYHNPHHSMSSSDERGRPLVYYNDNFKAIKT